METLINSKYTKEDIVQRIVFTIAKKWQINDKEVATRFDPLMMLLVEVVAQELDIINSQWKRSVEEITDSIIQRFFPKYPVREHLPHVAVMQAQPIEADAVVPAFFDFQLQQPDHTLHFTPIKETRILNIKTHSLWVNEAPFAQHPGFQSSSNGVVRSIGLLCQRTTDLERLDGLQIYIDTGAQLERSMLLYALQHGTCTVNGEAVDMKIGYKHTAAQETGFGSVLQELCLSLYGDNFISLSQTHKIQPLTSEHGIWQHLNDRDKKELDAQTTVFLRWELPVLLQERWVNQLSIHLNAFVGINRKQAFVQHKLDPFVNLIPLAIDQHLLFVDQIKGDTQEQYQAAHSGSEDGLQDGTYLLQSAHFGKLSSDSLRHCIQDLKEQVNSSNAFFSNVSNDYIGRHLQEMQRIVYRLEDKMSKAISLKQQLQYLIVKPFRADKFVTVSYWTFDNQNLEKLRPETVLECKGSLIGKGSARLLTKAYPLAAIYKNTLNQPLRPIVSKHDVETLAQNVFGAHFDSMEVERSYQSTNSVGQNKQLTLVLTIRLKPGYDPDFLSLDHNRIMYEMERNSLLSYPFSVNIIHA